MTIDRLRGAVYAAEDSLRPLLVSGGVVDFHGSMLDVGPELKFGTLAAADEYLEAIRLTGWGCADTPRPRLVHRRGPRKATWTAPTTIAIPTDQQWAMRETVLLHEYAHHVAFHRYGSSIHDRTFCTVLLELVAGALSPAVELLLRAALTDEGIFRAQPL